MDLPSKQVSRRAALAFAAATGFHVANRADPVLAQDEYPVEEMVTQLPDVAEGVSIRVWRTTFAPGQSRDRRYLGKTSIMVESGTMAVPLTLEDSFKGFMTGPRLEPPGPGTPASWTSEPWQPPDFTKYQGLIAEDGDFGVIENNGTDDLVVIVIETIPDLRS